MSSRAQRGTSRPSRRRSWSPAGLRLGTRDPSEYLRVTSTGVPTIAHTRSPVTFHVSRFTPLDNAPEDRMLIDSPYLVTPGKKFRLDDYETDETGPFKDREEAAGP